MFKQATVLLALLLLCGCFKVEDELTLNADGSGVVRLTCQTTIPPEMSAAMNMNRRGQSAAMYPPVSVAEAKYFFPEKDFQLTTKETKNDKGETVLNIEAKFKDVSALLASPYARAHALTIHNEKGVLRVRGVSGIEAVARYAEIKDETGQMQAALGAMDMEKQKQEMRSEFRVVLPNEIAATTGEKKAKAAAWVFERAKFTNGVEFAEKAGAVLEASAPATGVTFSPTNLPRLALTAFADLQPGSAGAATSVDKAKVASAAKFVPYALHVTRTLDLAGEGGWGQNEAKLIGAVVLPTELAPQRWGQPKLEEAVDAKGGNLVPKDRERFSSSFFGREFDDEDGEEGEESAEASSQKPRTNVERHPVTLTFQPPDWNVKEIGRVKGKIDLQYFGAAEVLKISNAIPAKWIADASQRAGMAGFAMDRGDKTLRHPRLTELGLTAKLSMGMVQAGATMLMFQTEGTSGGISDAQIYDARGKPWPTFVQSGAAFGGDANQLTVSVPGKPEAPLSLAFIVNGGGNSVEVPIVVEKIAVRGN